MKTKRFFSVLIALLMIISCFAVSASADETANPAIKDTKEPVSLTIVLTSGTADQKTAGTQNYTEGVEKTVTGTPVFGSTFQLYLQDAQGNIPDEPIAQGQTDSTGKVTFTKNGNIGTAGSSLADPLAQGRYTVKNSDLGTGQSALVADFDVDLPMTNYQDTGFIYNVYVYPKIPVDASVPSVTKQVAKGTTNNFGQSADIHSINNEVATWKITSDNLPASISEYNSYVFTDVVDERLVPDTSSVVVKYKDASDAEKTMTAKTDYTAVWTVVAEKYNKVVVTLTKAGIGKLEAGKSVFFTYTTTINTEKAGSVAQIIGNHVILDYKNSADVTGKVDNTPSRSDDDSFDPDNPSKWPETVVPNPDYDPTKPDDETDNPPTITIKTPSNPGDELGKDDPYVWTGKIEGLKTNNAATPAPLSGAKFTLYTDAACTTKAAGTLEVETGANGKFSFIGLEKGTYYLLETKAPNGYELNGTPTKIEIVSPLTADQTATRATAVSVTIKNIPSTKLPVTGGMGVGMFAVVGAVLAAAGVVLMNKSRKAKAC